MARLAPHRNRTSHQLDELPYQRHADAGAGNGAVLPSQSIEGLEQSRQLLPGHAQAAIAAYPQLGNTGNPVEVSSS